MNAMMKPTHQRQVLWEPYVPYIEAPEKTTINFGEAAKNPAEGTPFVEAERITANAIGIVMPALIRLGVTENHKYTNTLTRPSSVLCGQVLETWRQLQFGNGANEMMFRYAYRQLCGHYPTNVMDIRGGEPRMHDARMLVSVVHKVSPWLDFAHDFENYVFADDNSLNRSFITFFFTILRRKMFDKAVAYGNRKTPYRTNTALLWLKQEGDKVKLTFRSRWAPWKGRIVFAGDVADRCGSTFKIERITLTAAQALSVIESFNWTADNTAADLNALERAQARRVKTGIVINPIATKQRIPGYEPAVVA